MQYHSVCIFQSTLLQEERHTYRFKRSCCFCFQSTLLQEERHVFYITICISFPFNPRSYKRSDPYTYTSRKPSHLSIHAPTRGATVSALNTEYKPLLSIHAPTRGATMYSIGTFLVQILSIHAPTRGATAKMHNIPYASLQ